MRLGTLCLEFPGIACVLLIGTCASDALALGAGPQQKLVPTETVEPPNAVGPRSERPTALPIDPQRPAPSASSNETAPPDIHEFEKRVVEPILVRTPTGSPVRCTYVSRDARGLDTDHGPDWRWHANGQIALKRVWRNGRLNGLAEEWSASGFQRARGAYVDDQRDGLWLQWYETGAPASYKAWKLGKLHGLAREWAPNGVKTSEVEWKDGQKSGPWLRHAADGRRLESGSWVAGVLDGEWSEWATDGRLLSRGRYALGKEMGPWLRVATDRSWAEEVYVNGALDGLTKRFDAAGKFQNETTYVAGKAHGLSKEWYPSGQLKSETEYVAGVQDGRVKFYTVGGQKQIEGQMRGGKRVGRWVYYLDGGTIDPTWSGVYSDDKKVAEL